ncbi:transketolase family protein [bacterium]|nr:transketolase family protein [bacterium]
MINKLLHLNPKLFKPTLEHVPNRKGFGDGLYNVGTANKQVVAVCADLEESTQMNTFAKAFPERFIEVGVAEQNLVTVASGLAAAGKVPFVTSYAAFSPGRNWEQIRTTICLNDQPVKIVGSHAGVSVGPDGATHQMLEDIALMRTLPNMIVVVPCDYHEARRATEALAKIKQPAYLRLAREKTAAITTERTPFAIGKAQVLWEGSDITVVACGPLVYEALVAAKQLAAHGVSVEVINSPTVKPLDHVTILRSAKKTKAVITVEEAQVNGGLGGAVAELLGEQYPVPMYRIGVRDRFGQSGTLAELWDEYELNAQHIEKHIYSLLARKPQ